MKDERKTEIKVGITVILALVCLVWILGWAKNVSLNSGRKVLTIRFQSVSGLEVGDQVTVNGVRRGYVDGILTDKNSVLVTVSMDKDALISSDAQFHVEMLDLMGGKKVEITPGDAAVSIDYSKVAQGHFSPDIPGVMRTVGNLSQDLPEIMNALKTTLTRMNEFLGDEQIKSDLKTSLAELKTASVSLNQFLDKNSGKMSSLISNTNEVMDESKKFLKKNSDELESTLRNIQKMTKDGETLLNRFDGFIGETKDQKNNLGKMLYDDKLIGDTKALLKSVQETLETLNSQLKNDGVNVRAKMRIF